MSTPRAYPETTTRPHLAISSPHARAALKPWLVADREPQILPGDTVTVPFQVAGQLGVSAARESGVADLALSVEAFAIGNPGVHVLVVSVGKTV